VLEGIGIGAYCGGIHFCEDEVVPMLDGMDGQDQRWLMYSYEDEAASVFLLNMGR
jgi:hypothetical protein